MKEPVSNVHASRSIELDKIDLRILSILQTNGRIANTQLADMVSLSPSPCLRRVKRLEEEGVISRYVALADANTLGLSTTAFVRVSLVRQDEEALTEFEAEMSTWPEVMECYLMTGSSDYQLRVVTSDLPTFEAFLRHRLIGAKGVANIQTSFALRPVIYRTELPVRLAETRL